MRAVEQSFQLRAELRVNIAVRLKHQREGKLSLVSVNLALPGAEQFAGRLENGRGDWFCATGLLAASGATTATICSITWPGRFELALLNTTMAIFFAGKSRSSVLTPPIPPLCATVRRPPGERS